MSLHNTPERHKADPPAAWQVVKAADRLWHLRSSLPSAHVIDSFKTKREAEAAKVDGFAARLWAKEERWYNGEPVENWKPWAQVQAERERREAWLAAKTAARDEGRR